MKVKDFFNVICEAFSREPDSLSLEDTPESVEEWDSVGHLSIISLIDEELNVAVDDDDLRSFTSIGELVDRLKARNALED